MAACKRKKDVVQKVPVSDRKICVAGDPNRYYGEHPSWRFNNCDSEMWPVLDNKESFYEEVFPKLMNWETQTWSELLINAKKQNHSIDVSLLNPVAKNRLDNLHIEMDAIISLRLSATHRIYGYMVGATFHILWYDTKHGDNQNCVVRSHKKHT